MTPTHTQKGTRRYRYYVSQAVLQMPAKHRSAAEAVHGNAAASAVRRLAAPELEARVCAALREALPQHRRLADAELVAEHLAQVVVHPDRLVLSLTGEEANPITIAWTPPSTQRRREIVLPTSLQHRQIRSKRARGR